MMSGVVGNVYLLSLQRQVEILFCNKLSTLTVPVKYHLKMLSADVVCCIDLLKILINLCIESNSEDTGQTAPAGAI